MTKGGAGWWWGQKGTMGNSGGGGNTLVTDQNEVINKCMYVCTRATKNRKTK